MPGVYVADRNAPPGGRAGLTLPFTPTTGPIMFGPTYQSFRYVAMNEYFAGKAAGLGGLWTNLISECAVFCAAEKLAVGWGGVYFTHVQGGDWAYGQEGPISASALARFTQQVMLANCYTLMVVPGSSYSNFVALPGELGFPPERASLYLSNTGNDLGIAIALAGMAEFGEVGAAVPAAYNASPFGFMRRNAFRALG